MSRGGKSKIFGGDELDGNGFPIRPRELRERRRMSRLVLGQLCGLSKNMIAKYERGERVPSVKNLVILADFFAVTVDDLLGR